MLNNLHTHTHPSVCVCFMSPAWSDISYRNEAPIILITLPNKLVNFCDMIDFHLGTY